LEERLAKTGVTTDMTTDEGKKPSRRPLGV
jgi:hypothetical protein